MKTNKPMIIKETVAVLIHIPKELYTEYSESVNKRNLKRQAYSTELFCKAIIQDIKENK